jgi:hypothetical protein
MYLHKVFFLPAGTSVQGLACERRMQACRASQQLAFSSSRVRCTRRLCLALMVGPACKHKIQHTKIH